MYNKSLQVQNQKEARPTVRMKRREVLQKKKAIDEIIKAATNERDHLAAFPSFHHHHANGLSVYLESGSGDQLSPTMKHYIQTLLRVNMEQPYGPEWPTEEKIKRREMVSPEARYIFVREAHNAKAEDTGSKKERDVQCHWIGDGNRVVGFVQYRFVVEEETPVTYVYELQLESHAQGKGLGKALMQLIELIARKSRMGAVMLTVQKENMVAMNFYVSKLRYMISTMSPSKIGVERSYEILCKAFSPEAKAQLEESKLE